MGSTIHRRDIRSIEFRRFSDFCTALFVLKGSNGILTKNLGETGMFLPLWFNSGGRWSLSQYKEFRKEAIGIETKDFRRVCRYINVKESVMVTTLYRMSILSVVRGQRVSERPRFRQVFRIPADLSGLYPQEVWIGFVLEKRRCYGGFK